jgi:hypothetical protein
VYVSSPIPGGSISYILEEGVIIYSLFLASTRKENVEEYPVFENHEAVPLSTQGSFNTIDWGGGGLSPHVFPPTKVPSERNKKCLKMPKIKPQTLKK